MKPPEFILPLGTKVVTRDLLDDTTGMLVAQHRLDSRRAGAEGTIAGVVGGHGGDVYWVEHVDDHRHPDNVAPYCWAEFDLAAAPKGGGGA